MQKIRCLYWYLVFLFSYLFFELIYLLLHILFLTHTLPLLISMGGLLGKFFKKATKNSAQRVSGINVLEGETKKTLEKMVCGLVNSGIFGKKINEVLVNMIKTLTEEDVNLVGVSLVGGTIFSIFVYGAGTVLLIIKIVKILVSFVSKSF